MEGFLGVEDGDDGIPHAIFNFGQTDVTDRLEERLTRPQRRERENTYIPAFGLAFVLVLGFLEDHGDVPVHGGTRLTGLRGGVAGTRRLGDLRNRDFSVAPDKRITDNLPWMQERTRRPSPPRILRTCVRSG
jgi:hypothetical protein